MKRGGVRFIKNKAIIRYKAAQEPVYPSLQRRCRLVTKISILQSSNTSRLAFWPVCRLSQLA